MIIPKCICLGWIIFGCGRCYTIRRLWRSPIIAILRGILRKIGYFRLLMCLIFVLANRPTVTKTNSNLTTCTYWWQHKNRYYSSIRTNWSISHRSHTTTHSPQPTTTIILSLLCSSHSTRFIRPSSILMASTTKMRMKRVGMRKVEMGMGKSGGRLKWKRRLGYLVRLRLGFKLLVRISYLVKVISLHPM